MLASEARLCRPHELSIRPIRPRDADMLQRAFQLLSRESRYFRFHALFTKLTRSALQTLTDVDQVDHLALVAFDAGVAESAESGVGVARCVRLPDRRDCAELAVTVADRAHGRGVARILVGALAALARERGIEIFQMFVLPDNAKAHRMARALGTLSERHQGDVIAYELSVDAVLTAALRRSAEFARQRGRRSTRDHGHAEGISGFRVQG